ncbi:MAG: NAD(P)-dependent dehydrogenase (short-subunit alcohol dehydrogenase family) [Cocleimonas sp.]|jgi:NAD(P)-dependent dehydrogenase (short-subunit alcohol dehydrogenase family)
MNNRLIGKVAVITGAAQGIGEEIAQVFAAEGANLILLDTKVEQLELLKLDIEKKWSNRVLIYKVDIANDNEVVTAINDAAKLFGQIDILVNNAGINAFHNFLTMSGNEWEKCLSVNLVGTMNCCKAVLKHMVERQYGTIVNIASVHSHKIVKGAFPYTVSKHALIGLTRSLGIEFSDCGVRVNSVSPGLIETPLADNYFDNCTEPAAEREKQRNLIPVKRFGQPVEVANTVLFLSTDEARFINATDILIDGGRSQIYCD